MSKMKTQEEYISDLQKINANIEVLGEYNGNTTKILHKCKICGYLWNTAPDYLLQKNGCPVCSHRAIGNPPEYKNSMWASENREFYLMYFTEEQTKLYMPNSTKSLNATCPYCGSQKMIKPVNFTRSGMRCICSDGQSFPNKFVYSVLSQLDLDITPEYSPKWANKKRYDDYIEKYNIIIENHGKQHYEYMPNFRYQTLDEQQQTDIQKMNLALSNGIDYYIVLNCYYANKNWIKKSIMESELPKILGFSENDINWDKAMQFALGNIVKQASEMFNAGSNVTEISTKLKVDKSTIRNYLQKATELGWCEYSPKTKQKVFCRELDMIFDSISAASRYTGATTAGIILCCQDKQKYAGRHPETDAELHWIYIKN